MEIPIVKLTIPEKVLEQVKIVLASGKWIDGSEVKLLEKNFAQYCDVKYCRAVSNGTTALMSIFHELGLKSGDEVIVPSFSFISSANCILFTGAKPVFVDINLKTYTMDPDDVKRKITNRTKAILPVHLYGLCAEIDALKEICTKNNLFLVEDAAQAHGASIKGQKSGSFGTAGAFSLYPTKNMFCGAEGGLITTDEKELYEKVNAFINIGQKEKYLHTSLGYNFRMAEINATIASYALSQLDSWNSQRQKNAQFLSERLQNLNNVIIPIIPAEYKHVFHQYSIRTAFRDKLIKEFQKEHIGYGIHYSIPIHQQPYYKSLGYNISLPNTEKVCKEIISLPVHPQLQTEQLEYLCQIIQKTLNT